MRATGLLDKPAAAQILSVNPRTLDNWASRGIGPVFAKVGDLRRYRQRDLQKFINRAVRAGEAAMAARSHGHAKESGDGAGEVTKQ